MINTQLEEISKTTATATTNRNKYKHNHNNCTTITSVIDRLLLFDHHHDQDHHRMIIIQPKNNDNNNQHQHLNKLSQHQRSSSSISISSSIRELLLTQQHYKRRHNSILFHHLNKKTLHHVLIIIILFQSILNHINIVSKCLNNNIIFLNVVNGFSSTTTTTTSTTTLNVIGTMNSHHYYYNNHHSMKTRQYLRTNNNYHHHQNRIIKNRSSQQQKYRRSNTMCLYGTVPVEIWVQCGISLLFGLYTDNVIELIFVNLERNKREQILSNKIKGVITYKTDLEADKAFESTLLYSAVNSITISSQIMFTILLIDIIQTLRNRNYIPPITISTSIMNDDGTTNTLLSIIPLSSIAYSIGFCVWIGLTLSTIKRTIFLQSVAGPGLGRVVLYDRLLDFIILASCIIFITVDILKIDLGMGAMSVLAGSGVSALLFSFASKDLAEGIVGGFIVQAWDAFENGDLIRLEDNTEGEVIRIGLVDTEIMLRDNVIVKIPNSQLTKIRLSNISRVKISQVEQTLRFHYNDLSLLHDVILDEIENEIKQQCPNVITDGSKPFYITLTEYQSDCIIIAKLNCHFNHIQPKSTEYYEIQQKVIFIIYNVLQEHNVSLV